MSTGTVQIADRKPLSAEKPTTSYYVEVLIKSQDGKELLTHTEWCADLKSAIAAFNDAAKQLSAF